VITFVSEVQLSKRSKEIGYMMGWWGSMKNVSINC